MATGEDQKNKVYRSVMRSKVRLVEDFNSTELTRIDRAKCGRFTIQIRESCRGEGEGENRRVISWWTVSILAPADEFCEFRFCETTDKDMKVSSSEGDPRAKKLIRSIDSRWKH